MLLFLVLWEGWLSAHLRQLKRPFIGEIHLGSRKNGKETGRRARRLDRHVKCGNCQEKSCWQNSPTLKAHRSWWILPETPHRPSVAEKLFFLEEIHEEILWPHSDCLRSHINKIMRVKAQTAPFSGQYWRQVSDWRRFWFKSAEPFLCSLNNMQSWNDFSLVKIPLLTVMCQAVWVFFSEGIAK